MSNTLARAGQRREWLLKALAWCVIAASCAALGADGALAAAMSQSFKAGAGRATVHIEPGTLPLDGFTEVRDELQTRVLLLDNGGARMGLVVVDQTSMQAELIDKLRETISTIGHVAPENVLICASHTFSAPHISLAGNKGAEEMRKHQQLFVALRGAMQRATADAVASMQNARIGFAAGTSHVNVNRDMQTAEGWWLGSDEHGDSDKSVGVVRVDGADGKPLAVLMNYAVQASIMNESIMKSGGRAVTADLAGAATRHVEQQYGNSTVSMFLVGAAGDQAPFLVSHRYTLDMNGKAARIDAGDAGYPLVELLGERLGTEVVRVNEGIRTGDANRQLRLVQENVTVTELASNPNPNSRRPSRTYDFVKKGDIAVPYWIMQVGDIALVGLQAELSSNTGRDIKAHSPFKNTIVMTMVNGAAKYLPEAAGFDNNSYEAQGSRYGKGAAEMVAARVINSLTALRKQQ
jgi:hypothetical protein